MIEQVSGTERAAAARRDASGDHQAYEELDSRQIVREAMRSRAFREAKMSLTKGHRLRHDTSEGTGAEHPKRRPGAGSHGLAGARGEGPAGKKEAEVSIRVDTEALLESINFNEGSIEELVSKGLQGRLKRAEANLVAFELGKLINCSSYCCGMTVEKQAANREVGLRIAEHFAQRYFGEPGEARKCLRRIKSFIRRNEMLDKGYYYWEGQAYESYKPVPISIVYKFGGVHWSKETVEKFRRNERKVARTISNAKAMVNDRVVADKLAQVYAKFERIRDSADRSGDLSEVQKILDIHSILDF